MHGLLTKSNAEIRIQVLLYSLLLSLCLQRLGRMCIKRTYKAITNSSCLHLYNLITMGLARYSFCCFFETDPHIIETVLKLAIQPWILDPPASTFQCWGYSVLHHVQLGHTSLKFHPSLSKYQVSAVYQIMFVALETAHGKYKHNPCLRRA